MENNIIEIRHLSKGVDTGIGSAAADNLYRRIQQTGKHIFQFCLYGALSAAKTLPSLVTAAVIHQFHPKVLQGTPP